MASSMSETTQPAPFPTARNFKGRGPRSLVSMCSRVLALNIDKVRAADLRDAGIPYRVLRSIWSEIKCLNGRSNTPPLSTWVKLSAALRSAIPAENMAVPLELYRHYETLFVPDLANLSVYRVPLLKLGTDYIVSLRIDSVPNIDTPDFFALARLRNLDTLDIIEDMAAGKQTVINDRLLRGWSEVGDAFPALTFLRLRPGEAIGALTMRSLESVSKFPLLRVYDVLLSLTSVTHQAEAEFGRVYEYPSCGWECVGECPGDASGFGLHPACHSIGNLRQSQLLTVYLDDETEILPTQLADSPPSTAEPRTTRYVVRKRDEAVCSTWTTIASDRAHSQSFWRSALLGSMSSAPSKCDKPIPAAADLPLPPKPHVSVALRDENEPYLKECSHPGRKGYVFHRRTKRETRRWMSGRDMDPDMAKLPWHALEKARRARSAEDQGNAKKRKLEVEAGVDQMPERQKRRQAGEQGNAKQGSANSRLARQRRLRGKDVGDILKEMQGGHSPRGGQPT